MTSIVRRFQGLGVALIAAATIAGCSREPAGFEIQTGTDVTVERKDGVTIAGRLVDVQPQEVVVQSADGTRTRVPRSEIQALRAVTAVSLDAAAAATTTAAPSQAAQAPAPPAHLAATEGEPRRADLPRAATAERAANGAPAAAQAAAEPPAPAESPALPEYREVEIPAGTALPITLRTPLGSATSAVEDQVRGTLRRAVTIDGIEAIPAGTTVLGTVTQAERSGRVKGRARVAFRFAALELDGEGRVPIRTATIAREADGTKKQDAAKIGGGAAAGAVIGGLLGGGDGAAKGAAVGGGAGTGVVLATRGKEVTLAGGTAVSTRLTAPLTVRVRIK